MNHFLDPETDKINFMAPETESWSKTDIMSKRNYIRGTFHQDQELHHP